MTPPWSCLQRQTAELLCRQCRITVVHYFICHFLYNVELKFFPCTICFIYFVFTTVNCVIFCDSVYY